ncbi:MAG: hypothetical protein J6A38_01710 [Clostridia bacterium]|nr:hypothetical protein [Clostridia bacterium]
MKTNKTKLLTKVFACTMAIGLVFATGCSKGGKSESQLHEDFINEIGGVSETYVGAVSETSYATAQEAATAYVAEEIVGSADATVINAESKGELTSEQVTALQLPADIQEGMQSVEKLEVEYSVAENSYMDTLNTNKKVTVYVIKYANDFKYYSPMPVTGETITKSYYDSVFDYEKYKNCTYSMDMTTTYEISLSIPSYGSMEMDMTMTMHQFAKYAEGKIYLEQSMTMTVDGDELLTEGMGDFEEMNESLCVYLEEVDGETVCYVKTDVNGTEWNPTELHEIGFYDLEELTPFYDQYLDYTYFTKTNYGFEISSERMEKFLAETFEMADMSAYAGMLDIDLLVKYYVNQGALSGMREDGTISINASEDGMSVKAEGVVEAIAKVTNYGTTVVEKPFTE